MASGEAELGGFLEAAGRSLESAQRELTRAGAAGNVAPTTIAISEVELEVKATFEETESGALGLRPVSRADASAEGISSDVLSTVRVRYVPIAGEAASAAPEAAGAAAEISPARSAEEVIEEVRLHPDISPLERAVGRLEFRATFVPSARRWLVEVGDSQNRTVRELVVPDSPD